MLHVGTSSKKCCHIKLWRIMKESSVWRAFNIICIVFYCGLYTMVIDVVTWRIIKKCFIWSLHLHNFLCLPVFALFLQKIRQMSCNSSNFIYIYIFKIEIRNTEMYLPEVSVSSTMGNSADEKARLAVSSVQFSRLPQSFFRFIIIAQFNLIQKYS